MAKDSDTYAGQITPEPTTAPVTMGNGFEGDIRYVSIYNYALDSSDIVELDEAMKPLPEPPPDDYATKGELNALAEIVDVNSEAINLNAQEIRRLDALLATIRNDVEGVMGAQADLYEDLTSLNTRLAEHLAMIQRLESKLAAVKNAL